MTKASRFANGVRAGVIATMGLAGMLGTDAAIAQQRTQESGEMLGRLANGTEFSLYKPANWNGMLVLNADLPALFGNRQKALYDSLHALGYATGGKARDITGWDIRRGATDIVQLKALFTDRFGAPSHTIVTGYSLGGLVSRYAIEAYPDHFDGAVPTCGGGAGLIAMWNQRLDVVFAAKTLLADPGEHIDMVGAADYKATGETLKRISDRALQSPAGRARLALTAAIGQISGWPTGAPQPPADSDYDTRLRTYAGAVAGMSNLREGLEQPAGGVVNWNVGVDYKAVFASADEPTIAMVRALYRGAGLDLDADLAKLDAAPRVQADPAAVAWARATGALTGRLEHPTLVLYTAVDPRAALSEFRDYQRTVDEAGATAMLRQAGVYRSGHCVFTHLENITAITAVADRIRTGQWPDTSPAALNARGAGLASKLDSAVGDTLFAQFDAVPEFPRHFTATAPLPAGALKR